VTRLTAEREQARLLHAHAVPLWQIAQRLGVSQHRVAAWLRRAPTSPRRRPTFAPRTCRLCGEPFTPTNGRQRYCTPAHRQQHHRPQVTERTCRLCGQRFMPASPRQRFCTAAHREQYRRLHNPSTVRGWRERVHALEAEISRVRAQLHAREAQ
jgi:hypothetical protein